MVIETVARGEKLVDALGRPIRYLRLSLTSACQMRCVYCRPKKMAMSCGSALLTSSEIEALVSHLVTKHGLEKLRLTGGEPTARPDLLNIVRRLADIDGLDELTMTTNGLRLDRLAAPLAHAGLSRVNISLDSLDADRFRQITGVDGLSRVLAGIDAAMAAGLNPVKLNTVVIRGENNMELGDLLRYAVDRDLEIRFIELMPMGPLADQWAERYMPESVMRQTLDNVVESWRQLPQGSEAARRYRIKLRRGQAATIGFVTPMSCNFCATCDRIRIAADGTFYPCLMDAAAGNLLPALRPDVNVDEIDRLLQTGLSRKAREHPTAGVTAMTHIGG